MVDRSSSCLMKWRESGRREVKRETKREGEREREINGEREE